ncbi:MAG TPA: hypothetical protein VFE65_13340 [Pseudonocardia sp.]|jgi:hypothetical protein|nr:hypothetical protein [Pseudonocardia sp.]
MGAVFLATYIALLAVALTLTINYVRVAETDSVKAGSQLEHVRYYWLGATRAHLASAKPRLH